MEQRPTCPKRRGGGRGPRGIAAVAGLVAIAMACPTTRPVRGGERSPWAEIRVVDRATGRGVPLVELRTVHNVLFVTDDAGRVAFQEPGLMDRPVYFHLRAHGYDIPADGFGFRGRRVTPRAGDTVEIAIERRDVAERLGRLTGQGRLRDSVLLGRASATPAPLPGGVAGQDSVQAAVYRGEVRWFWGDTARISYPLGLFRTCGATTPLPDPLDPASDPATGIPFHYLVGSPSDAEPDGFARPMMPYPERPEGVIWIDGVCTVPDAGGRERLVAHYSRRRGLPEELEQGIAVWDDDAGTFVVARELPLEERWRRPSSHPIAVDDPAGAGQGGARRVLLFNAPACTVRVPAEYEAVLDPSRYEAFGCTDADGGVRRGPDGRPEWSWRADLPPTGPVEEARLVAEGRLAPDECRFFPRAAGDAGERRVRLHSGTVRWNAHRRRWVMVAGEIGGDSSHLGEVWYAEGDDPSGPFALAVKIASHDKTSFYNVCHHDFLDREGGRTIHFEGTLSRDFSGGAEALPRADYNQVLYRLDLDAPALAPARAP